jgi:hypothetical protein
VLADKDPSFLPENFCRVIRALCLAGIKTIGPAFSLHPRRIFDVANQAFHH